MFAPNTGSLHDETIEGKTLLAQMASTPLLGIEGERELATELRRLRDLIKFYQQTIAESLDAQESEFYHAYLIEAEAELTRKRDQFFYANVRLVLDIVGSMSRMEYMDMFQWGVIGLMRAVDLYDPTLDVRFSTYATYWIKQAIQRGCDKDESLIALPVHVRDMLKVIRRASIRFISEFRFTPNLEQVCSFAGLDYAKVMKIKAVAELPLSLDKRQETEEMDGALLDVFADEASSALDDLIAAEERVAVTQIIRDSLDRLAAVQADDGSFPYTRHAQIIRLRYRIGEETPLVDPIEDVKVRPTRTLEEVAQMMTSHDNPDGITRERARQLQRAGFHWIVSNCPELQLLKEE